MAKSTRKTAIHQFSDMLLVNFNRQEFVDEFEDANPEVRVCSMCDGYLGNAEVDHFYPKAAYPYLSCHPYNLVPVCKDCNGRDGKHDTPPLSRNATGHQTADWFHPYLRSADGTYTISFERQQEGTTPVLTSTDKQTQVRLTNLRRYRIT
jgi:5-methylcytosine-specific restriction endonuclease McrA